MRQVIDDATRENQASKPDRKRTVVITDGGDQVGLVLLDPAVNAAAGSRFEHQGRTWVVRGCRHHSRVLVAEPLDSGRQKSASASPLSGRATGAAHGSHG